MFHQPYLGCREFPANFSLIEEGDSLPPNHYGQSGTQDLQWMLWDIDYASGMEALFFRAAMIDGIIEVPDLRKGGSSH
ncbi:CRISPR-associated protein Cas5 [compost metagenome]